MELVCLDVRSTVETAWLCVQVRLIGGRVQVGTTPVHPGTGNMPQLCNVVMLLEYEVRAAPARGSQSLLLIQLWSQGLDSGHMQRATECSCASSSSALPAVWFSVDAACMQGQWNAAPRCQGVWALGVKAVASEFS